MLIEFSVSNFRSIKEKVVFSMLPSPIREHPNHVFSVSDKLSLLKAAMICGANASGKSNIVEAMRFMRRFIFDSSKATQAEDKIPVEPFRLNSAFADSPSSFEMIFIHHGIRYRYGFSVDRDKIHREWLYAVLNVREAELFTRTEDAIHVTAHYKEGKGLQGKTRKNALFLSVVAQFNGERSQTILNWFRNSNVISGLNDHTSLTLRLIDEHGMDFKQHVLDFLKVADLGINDFEVEKENLDSDNLPENMPAILKKKILMDLEKGDSLFFRNVNTSHKKYDQDNNEMAAEFFALEEDESHGTQKFFGLAGPILDTLINGGVLIIDEMDSRLHPLLAQFIVGLFHDPESNTRNAQLIFIALNTHLLDKKFFRRDQIWFTEKDRYGATDLYCLVEYKVRNDASYGKDYIQGRYGAIPYLGDPQLLVKNEGDTTSDGNG